MTHRDRGGGGENVCEKEAEEMVLFLLSAKAPRLHLAVTLAVTPHGNCNNFSISISKLASEHIFKTPPVTATL